MYYGLVLLLILLSLLLLSSSLLLLLPLFILLFQMIQESSGWIPVQFKVIKWAANYCIFFFSFFFIIIFVFTCVYFASGSKCGLSTSLTSGEMAAGKLVLFNALHSSSLALEKAALSLTGGERRERRGGETESERRLQRWKR